MDAERQAAKRRASFGRADRLAKAARQKTEEARVARNRQAERAEADQQRKHDAAFEAERRVLQARWQNEQRRSQRKADQLKSEFTRKAEDRRAEQAKAERQRQDEAAKVADRKRTAEEQRQRREAASYVAQQEKRQQHEQQQEHRRQTARLRAEHQAERSQDGPRRAAGIIHHARQIRSIDLAEQRELDALDQRRHSLGGRVVALVRGSTHFDRQERAIVDRHESERWQKHREHEARKDRLFWTEQAERLRQVSDRHDMATRHRSEVQEQRQSQERGRERAIDARVKAMVRPSERQHVRQQDNVRPMQPFGRAAGRELEIKR